MDTMKYVNVDECIKYDYVARDISIDRLIPNRENITFVWFHSKLTKTDISMISFVQKLRSLSNYVLLYTEKSLYLNYLMCRQKKDDYIIVISHNTEVIDETYNCKQVRAVLLKIDGDDDENQNMIFTRKDRTFIGAFKDEDSLLREVEKIVNDIEQEIDQNIGNIFSIFNRKERTFRDLRHDFISFIWCHIFKVLIKAMPHTHEARDEMLEEYRSYYSDNAYQLAMIDKFEQDYNGDNAIRWYTKQCFLFRLLNKALRTENIEVLYTFRYFIVDLCQSLECAHRNQDVLRVYHGGQISRDEIENYKIGTLVVANGFLSTTRDLQVAYHFAGLDLNSERLSSRSREDDIQFVLFQIDIGTNVSSETIWADISAQSTFPDEKEVLFDLGSIFEIVNIKYDCKHYYWHIEMHPSTDISPRKREYEYYIRQQMKETNPTILFGILLTDMGEYEQSMKYFQRLLKRIPDDHEDRSNIYYSLARIYRFIDQQEKALEYFYLAEQLQRTKLPNSTFDLARTLAGIATVYYELENFDQELAYYQQSMAIYQEIVPENHIEMSRIYSRLGFAYVNQQKYDIALEYFSKSLEIYNQLVPDGHPGVAQVFHNMGIVYDALEHTEKSLNYYEKSLNMRESILPNDHFHIGQSYHQMSLFYKKQHQHDLALQFARRALSIYEKKLSTGNKLIKQVHDIINSLVN